MATVPPLRIFLYSMAMVVGIVTLLALYRNLPGDRRDNTIAGQTQRFLGAPHDPEKVRVIALGSSLLWAATPQATSVQEKSMPEIAWMRMTKTGTGLGHLRASLEMIERYRPDVLVLEENMLLPDSGHTLMDTLRQEAGHFVKKTFSLLSASQFSSPIPAYWERNDQERNFYCNSTVTRLTPAQMDVHVIELQKMYLDAALDPSLITWLARLSQSGVHIVLLDIRRSSAIEQATAQQKQQWRAHLETALAPTENIHYLSSPTYPLQAMYCDGSHLSVAGARLFAPWLQTQLQLLRKVR